MFVILEETKEKAQKSSKLSDYQDKAKEKGISDSPPVDQPESSGTSKQG